MERYPSDKTINKGKKDCSLFFSLPHRIVEGKYIQGNNREKEKGKVGFRIAGSVLQNSTRDGMNLRSIEPESTTNLVRGTGATRRYIPTRGRSLPTS